MKNRKIIFLVSGAAIIISLAVLGMSLIEHKEVATPPYVSEKKTEDLSEVADTPTTAEPQAPAKAATNQPKPPTLAVPLPDSKNATVIAGEATAILSFDDGDTFYDALMEARNEGKLQFSGKNYPALGFFVTDIGTLHSGNGDDLLYYINGKEAAVGVSAYVLKDGDIIEWKLK